MPRRPSEDDIRRIYRETVDELFAFVARRCDGDRDLAEDITQETWLRAVRAWRKDGIPERPLAWLSTVAARLLSNHRRRPAAERFDDGSGDTLPAPDTSSSRRNMVDSLCLHSVNPVNPVFQSFRLVWRQWGQTRLHTASIESDPIDLTRAASFAPVASA